MARTFSGSLKNRCTALVEMKKNLEKKQETHRRVISSNTKGHMDICTGGAAN